MTNIHNSVIYAGITNDLKKRVWQHKEKVSPGFTQRYNANLLVYYELFDNPIDAIVREKQIKAGSRKKKVELIRKMNPEWKDLYEDL